MAPATVPGLAVAAAPASPIGGSIAFWEKADDAVPVAGARLRRRLRLDPFIDRGLFSPTVADLVPEAGERPSRPSAAMATDSGLRGDRRPERDDVIDERQQRVIPHSLPGKSAILVP